MAVKLSEIDPNRQRMRLSEIPLTQAGAEKTAQWSMEDMFDSPEQQAELQQIVNRFNTPANAKEQLDQALYFNKWLGIEAGRGFSFAPTIKRVAFEDKPLPKLTHLEDAEKSLMEVPRNLRVGALSMTAGAFEAIKRRGMQLVGAGIFPDEAVRNLFEMQKAGKEKVRPRQDDPLYFLRPSAEGMPLPGAIGAEAFGIVSRLPDIGSKIVQRRQRQVVAEQDRVTLANAPITRLMRTVVANVPMRGAAIGVGVLTGDPIIALAMMGEVETGRAFVDQLAAAGSLTKSMFLSELSGAAEIGGEMLVLPKIIKGFEEGLTLRQLLNIIAENAGQEGVTEFAQRFIEVVGTETSRNTPLSEAVKLGAVEGVKAMPEGAFVGGVMAGGEAGVAMGFGYMRSKLREKQAEIEPEADLSDEQADLVMEMMQDPEALADAIGVREQADQYAAEAGKFGRALRAERRRIETEAEIQSEIEDQQFERTIAELDGINEEHLQQIAVERREAAEPTIIPEERQITQPEPEGAAVARRGEPAEAAPEVAEAEDNLRSLQQEIKPLKQKIIQGERKIKAAFRGKPNAKKLARQALFEAGDVLNAEEREQFTKLGNQINKLRTEIETAKFGTPLEQEQRQLQRRETHQARIKANAFLEDNGHLNDDYLDKLHKWAEQNNLEVSEYISAAGVSQYLTVKRIEADRTRTEILKIRLSDHTSGQLSASMFRDPDIDIDTTNVHIPDIAAEFESNLNEALSDEDDISKIKIAITKPTEAAPELTEVVEETEEQLSGITKSQRRTLIKQTQGAILSDPVYQIHQDAISQEIEKFAFPSVAAGKGFAGEVAEAIQNHPILKGRISLKPTFTSKHWDAALAEIDEQGMDITEFLDRMGQALEAQQGRRVLNETAMNRALEAGNPFTEIQITKNRLLRQGMSDIQINQEILDIAERYEMEPDAVIDDLINPARMKELAKITDELELDAELGRMAEKQIIAEEQMEAQQAAKEVLEANDIHVPIETVPEIERRRLGVSPGIFGQDVISPISGEQAEFLDKEDFLLPEPDVEGQLRLPEGPADDIPFQRDRTGRILGAAMSQGETELILLAYGADSETGYHEAYHIIKPKLTDKDLAVVVAAYPSEEQQARAFAAYAKGQDVKVSGPIKRIFEKLMKILRKIRSALVGKGFRTPEDIFGEIVKGRIEIKNVTATGETIQYEMKLDVSSLTKEELAKINTYMKRAGYDVRGTQDVKEILERMTDRFGRKGILSHENWEKAVIHARTKKTQADTTKVIRKFGLTDDPKEAGYITQKGQMIDFSGRRFGADHPTDRGNRVMDHRQIHEAPNVEGGTEGMIKFMMQGNIRVGQGMIDMYTPPTTKQKIALRKYIEAHSDVSVQVEVNDGKFYKLYGEFANPREVIRDIEAYWNQREATIKFETSGERMRRETEHRARVKARKARLAEQHERVRKPKKKKGPSIRRTKIRLQDTTPPLRADLAPPEPVVPSGIPVTPAPPTPKTRAGQRVMTDELLVEQRGKAEGVWKEAVSDRARDTALGLEKRFEAMSARFGRIHPKLKYGVRQYVFDHMVRTVEFKRATAPMVLGLRKFSKDDASDFKFLARNSSFIGAHERIEALVAKYGLVDEWRQYRESMDQIYDMAEQVGLDMGKVRDYWPRTVKNLRGLLRWLDTQEKNSPIQRALAKRSEQAGGRKLTSQEKAQVINTLLRGFRIGGVSLSRPGQTKERTIEFYDKEIDKYYYGLGESVEHYIVDMMQNIGAREFFGKQTREITNLQAQRSRLATRLHKVQTRVGYKQVIPSERHDQHISRAAELLKEVTAELEKKKGQTIEDSIGYYVQDLQLGGFVTADEQQQIGDMLRAIMEPEGLTGWARGFVKLAYLDVLNNIPVAMTQLEELGYSFHKDKIRALPAAMQAALGKSGLKLEDLGIDDINQYMHDLDFSRLAERMLFMMRAADRFGKQTFINTTLANMKAEASRAKPKAEFVNKLTEIFGPETQEVIEDLKAGRISDNVKFLAFNELADVQPIAITETPEAYARGRNWRLAYVLRQFTLKRFSYMRGIAQDKMSDPKNKPKQFVQGLKMLTELIFILTLFGVGKDAIRDWFLGKEFDLSDSVVENLLQFLLLSRYTTEKIAKQGPAEAIFEELKLPVKTPNAIWQDVRQGELNRTVRSIPFIGENYYWWFGGGTERNGGSAGVTMEP